MIERSIYLTSLRKDFARVFLAKPRAIGVDAGHVFRSWLFLLRWSMICVWRTLRFGWVCLGFVVNLLIPVPAKNEDRFKKKATGLPIPAMEMTMFLFGTLAVASYLW